MQADKHSYVYTYFIISCRKCVSLYIDIDLQDLIIICHIFLSIQDRHNTTTSLGSITTTTATANKFDDESAGSWIFANWTWNFSEHFRSNLYNWQYKEDSNRDNHLRFNKWFNCLFPCHHHHGDTMTHNHAHNYHRGKNN